MHLLLDERTAIVTLVAEFDLPGLMDFLGKAQLPPVAKFSSPLLPMPTIALQLMDWLDKNTGALPAALERMLAQFPAHPSAPLVQQALVRTADAQQAAIAAPPWQAALISGMPMVNRSPLRSVLQSLIAGWGPPVLMVDGPSGTGRSHSWFLINHVARATAGVGAVKVDLNAPVLEQQTLAVVADQLAKRLRIGPVAAPSTVGATAETVAVRYADEISTAWNNRAESTRMWIVFDSLDRPVAAEIRRFVCSLVAKRLGQEMLDCTFFLLGAGMDYGVSDPARLVTQESLSVFVDKEIDQVAQALNGLGRAPLPPPTLAQRIADMKALLAQGTPRDICAAVSGKLADLRAEVLA